MVAGVQVDRTATLQDGQTRTEISEATPELQPPKGKPPFTLADLKAAIPPHCFERSALTSFVFLLHDLAVVYTSFHIANNYIHLLPDLFRYVAWPLYWSVCSGALGGIWVIGHECGHQAFSEHGWLNDTVGFILHTALLAPYFSFKYSHQGHHANTGSLDRDAVFIPRKKHLQTKVVRFIYVALSTPPGRVALIITFLLAGWPLYLCFNITGRTYHRFANHFDPWSPIFPRKKWPQILLTDIGLLVMWYVIYHWVVAHGFSWVMCVYGIPVILVYAGFVTVTFLHHSHPTLPHYDSTEWDWLRGALCTIDRDVGAFNYIGHHICNTHILHHLFSKIPHYHAVEATNAIKPILGKHYRADPTPMYISLYRDTNCILVEPEDKATGKGVFWFTVGDRFPFTSSDNAIRRNHS